MSASLTDIIKQYETDPTIEEYVRLRREYPRLQIEVCSTGGLEFVFSQADELRGFGVSPSLVASAFEGDERSQSELSLQLLERLATRRRRTKRGETHLVSRKKQISDALTNYLIAGMLEALAWNCNESPCDDLVVLIKHQLGAITSNYERTQKRREQRKEAIWIAATTAASGEVPTYRKIAQVMGVEPSTVTRWFPEGGLVAEAEKLCREIKNLKVISTKKYAAARAPSKNEQLTQEEIDGFR